MRKVFVLLILVLHRANTSPVDFGWEHPWRCSRPRAQKICTNTNKTMLITHNKRQVRLNAHTQQLHEVRMTQAQP